MRVSAVVCSHASLHVYTFFNFAVHKRFIQDLLGFLFQCKLQPKPQEGWMKIETFFFFPAEEWRRVNIQRENNRRDNSGRVQCLFCAILFEEVWHLSRWQGSVWYGQWQHSQVTYVTQKTPTLQRWSAHEPLVCKRDSQKPRITIPVSSEVIKTPLVHSLLFTIRRESSHYSNRILSIDYLFV